MSIQEYLAIGFDDVDITKTDLNGRTIFHWAVLCHQPKNTLNLLIFKGAAIDALAIGRTPLSYAAEYGQAEIAELLINRGADINVRSNKGATPLLFAIEHKHKNIVDILLKLNADISIPLETGSDYHTKFKVVAGDTPLHVASKLGSTRIICSLLNKNANIETLNNQHLTPVDVAIKNSKYANELKLLDYLTKVNRREDNHYKASFKIFGHLFKFGCSAKQKKDAANALKNVIFDHADKSCLDAHRKALKNGQLKSIYRSLRIR